MSLQLRQCSPRLRWKCQNPVISRAWFSNWRVKQEGSGSYWKNIENHERNRIFTFKHLPSCPKKLPKPWPWKGLKLWVSPYGFHRMMQQQGMQRWPATSCSLPDNKENDKIAVDANDNQKYIIRYSSQKDIKQPFKPNMWILKCPNFQLQWLIECHSHIFYKSQMPKGKDSQHLLCSHLGSLELWRTWWEIETLGSSSWKCGVFWCDIRVTQKM